MIILGCIEFHLKKLCTMNYCDRVEDFINYALSNPKIISDSEIRCPCVKCKNKKSYYKDVVTMHLF